MQAGLQKALAVASKTNNDIAGQINERDKKRIADLGKTTIHQLTAEQRKQWKKAMEPVWNKFEGQIGKDLIAAAQKSNAQATN